MAFMPRATSRARIGSARTVFPRARAAGFLSPAMIPRGAISGSKPSREPIPASRSIIASWRIRPATPPFFRSPLATPSSFGTTNLPAVGQQGFLAQYDSTVTLKWAQLTPYWIDYMTYNNGRIYGAFGNGSTNFTFGSVNVNTDRAHSIVCLNETNGQAIWSTRRRRSVRRRQPARDCRRYSIRVRVRLQCICCRQLFRHGRGIRLVQLQLPSY